MCHFILVLSTGITGQSFPREFYCHVVYKFSDLLLSSLVTSKFSRWKMLVGLSMCSTKLGATDSQDWEGGTSREYTLVLLSILQRQHWRWIRNYFSKLDIDFLASMVPMLVCPSHCLPLHCGLEDTLSNWMRISQATPRMCLMPF